MVERDRKRVPLTTLAFPLLRSHKKHMSTISSRLYAVEKDFQIMLDLIPASHANDIPGKVDIEENLAIAEIRANTKLWFYGSQPIGWAYVDGSRNLYWELERQYTDPVGAEMVAWGAACIRRTLAAGETSTLDASCRNDDRERLDFIRRHAFRQTENITLHMQRDLSSPIPNPVLPTGFQIRPVKGIEEAEAIASMHRAAFGTEYMTTENRLIIMNSSEYDPSLDLVAIAPDRMLAAYCTCSIGLGGTRHYRPGRRASRVSAQGALQGAAA
jgi:hypothetical protein